MHPYMVTKDRANPGMLVTSSCHPNRLGHADPCRAANGASRLLLSKVRSSGLIPTVFARKMTGVGEASIPAGPAAGVYERTHGLLIYFHGKPKLRGIGLGGSGLVEFERQRG